MSDEDKVNPNIIDFTKAKEDRETMDEFFPDPNDEEYFNYLYSMEEESINNFNRGFALDLLSRYNSTIRRVENLQAALFFMMLIQVVLTSLLVISQTI
jgi:hypothetical protein